MKLLQLKVRGFRSLREIDWSPGDVNLLIGPNCSGKTNLLRAFELLSTAARGGLESYIQREGGIEPVLWDGRAEELTFEIRTSPLAPSAGSERKPLDYRLELIRLGNSTRYQIERELLADYTRVESGEMSQPFKFLERQGRRAVVYNLEEQGLIAPDESVPEGEALLSLAAGPFTANRWISSYQEEVAGWRTYRQFQTHRDAFVRQTALARYETMLNHDGQNLVPVLHSLYTGDRGFKRAVDDAMRAAFGGEYEELVFPPAADQRVQLRVRWKSLEREQSAADLSDGTLRFLYLLAILANPNPPPLVAIDEPEIGLHPSMLPIIAEHATEAALRTQVILATHSADLLDAFGENPPKTTVASLEDGETRLQVVSDDELRYWLDNYTLGKLFRSGELEAMA